MRKFNLTTFIWAIALLMLAAGCQKNVTQTATPSQQSVALYLTDAPGVFDNVFIDIQSVKIKIDTCSNSQHDQNDDNGNGGADNHGGNGGTDDHGNNSGGTDDHGGNSNHDGTDNNCEVWQSLNITTGVYDLLALRNGIDTLLAHGDNIISGNIDEIEITLGNNNSVVIDGASHSLSLANNAISIKVSDDDFDEFSPDHSRLWLDFDVASSIIQQGDVFILQPVIRFFTLNETGEVKGRINPSNAVASVKIYNTTDTAFAIPDREGEFEVRGLKPGTYNILVDATGNYQDATINNVVVGSDGKKDVGIIQLHQ